MLVFFGWEKALAEGSDNSAVESCDPMEAVNRLGEKFKIPLESAGVELDQLKAEFLEMQTNSIVSPPWTISVCGGDSIMTQLV